jgi:hypothetical protein
MRSFVLERSVRAAALSIALGLALGACGDSTGRLSTGPLIRATTGGGATSSIADALVGTWRRTIVFHDDAGFPHASETTWRFDGSGAVTRVVVARDLASGLADVIVATGRWRVDGGTLVVTFDPPVGGETRLDVRVAGDTLYLASQPYLRVR